MKMFDKVYGVKHQNEDIRAASRSGGFFTAVSDIVLEEGGVVYGVALNEHFLAEHRRAETKEIRDTFRGSKYVQADVGDALKQVEADLKQSKTVLFTGVPCQVHGLYNYLKLKNISTENLLTVEILCHGAPSPRVWEDFLKNKFDFSSIEAVDFRDKKNFGWRDHIETVTVKGEEFSSKDYTGLFYSHVILRESCFNCYYKKRNRVSDITIGDFWRIENNDKPFDDDKGISLVKINTVKGEKYFNQCANRLIIREYPIATCIQPALDHNYDAPKNRSDFWNEYNGENILELADKYPVYKEPVVDNSFKKRIKTLLKKTVKKTMKAFR